MIRLVLADDQELVRTGLRMILDGEPDLHVVGEAADGHQAFVTCQDRVPDVVLMDVRMPVMDGITATRKLTTTAATAGVKVLILTTFDLDEHVYAALAAGASGFLLKDVPARQLADAVRTVHSGDALLAPAVTRRLIARFVAQQPTAGTSASASDQIASLTEREREVLTLVARGLSNQEIAAAFVVGESTIKTHIGRIFAKLGARDRTHAVIAAYETGLVTPAG